MRTFAVALAGLAVIAVAGCGSNTPLPGQTLAAAACQASGATAETDAVKAAALNQKYATLSADETAAATSEAQQNAELNDGDPSDSSGDGSLTGALSVGTATGDQVLTDCLKLGLSVLHTAN